MKRILISSLMSMLLAIALVGCGKDDGGKKAEELLLTMITCSTDSEVEKNEDNLPTVFESYFSEEGYKDLVDLQMGYVYPEFLRLSQAKSTKNIRIKEVKRVKLREDIQVKYNLEYTVVYKNKQVKMKDQVVLKINQENQITELVILNTSDVIEKMFLGIRIL